ncbi:MAG TPA: hypothetical protein VHY58_21215 [Streptosporangiaceae bacterium]|nr:hypothetical protein [Streptosporangiaceae bacterium]
MPQLITAGQVLTGPAGVRIPAGAVLVDGATPAVSLPATPPT